VHFCEFGCFVKFCVCVGLSLNVVGVSIRFSISLTLSQTLMYLLFDLVATASFLALFNCKFCHLSHGHTSAAPKTNKTHPTFVRFTRFHSTPLLSQRYFLGNSNPKKKNTYTRIAHAVMFFLISVALACSHSACMINNHDFKKNNTQRNMSTRMYFCYSTSIKTYSI